MIDKHNSTAANTLEENPNVFVGVFPCHLVHIAASHARDSFSEVLDVNIGNLCIDFYCWFYKSSKRKDKLAEYFEFCEQEYKSILKHVSVRWFSLERCMDRILHKKPISKAYFLSGSFRDKSFERLDEFFRNLPLNPSQLFQSNTVQFSFILISYCKEMNQEFKFSEH